jgi:ABC-type nitrate/sulfonate/bicarbonate transport system ATPase subunit
MNYTINETLLQAQNIHLSFGDKVVLKDVNFTVNNIVRPDVDQGQVISLIGRSGCGKTQLLRIIGGLNTPTDGHVVINKDGNVKRVQAGDVGLVPQDYYLFPWRKVGDILNMAVSCNTHVDKQSAKDIIASYCQDFQISDHLDKYPAQLSGGQKQRVSITQQLLTGNKFLLMDEPFSGLDSLMIDKTMELINRVSVSHEHQTILIVSHDLSNSIALSDTAIVLANLDGTGTTVVATHDLMQMGLAWRKDIKRDSAFQDLLENIKRSI